MSFTTTAPFLRITLSSNAVTAAVTPLETVVVPATTLVVVNAILIVANAALTVAAVTGACVVRDMVGRVSDESATNNKKTSSLSKKIGLS